MKATGIVRRIDDLGRVVIPKEIRRTLRIRESDPLEIFTDRDGEIILKKYSPIGELGTMAKLYAESLSQTIGVRSALPTQIRLWLLPAAGKRISRISPWAGNLQNFCMTEPSFWKNPVSPDMLK